MNPLLIPEGPRIICFNESPVKQNIFVCDTKIFLFPNQVLLILAIILLELVLIIVVVVAWKDERNEAKCWSGSG
jgi:hypothetical protein